MIDWNQMVDMRIGAYLWMAQLTGEVIHKSIFDCYNHNNEDYSLKLFYMNLVQ